MPKQAAEKLEMILSVADESQENQGSQNESLDLLKGVLEWATPEKPETPRFAGMIIGTLTGLKNSGEPLVDFPSNPFEGYLPALTTVAVEEKEISRKVALVFEGGDPQKPVIVGLIQSPERRTPPEKENLLFRTKNPLEVEVDGHRVVFTAEKEIVLRCGEASITLTRAGKVLIRGTYLLSRSSGVNRIKGGSIQLN